MRTKIIEDEVYLPEPVGKQPKYWLCSYNVRYLFKQATYKNDGSPVYNDVSECMASDIGRLINIPTASYYLCTDKGKDGVITLDFLDNKLDTVKKEEFYDGVFLINKIDPGFKNTSLINPKTHQAYTVDLVLQSVSKYGLEQDAINMLVYDALIGNTDRNPSNYGIIINHETNKVRFAPLYDNCTSLGVSLVEHRLREFMDSSGNITNEDRLNEYVHKEIKGKVTLDRFLQYKEKYEWDNFESRRIMDMIDEKKQELLELVKNNQISIDDYHKELYKIGNGYRKFDISKLRYQTLISYLTNFYPKEIEQVVSNIKENITKERIDKEFDYYKDELPPDRLKFAKEFVLRRANYIVNYYYNSKEETRGKSK